MPYTRLEVTLKYIKTAKQLPAPIIRDADIAMEVIKAICNKKEILWREEMLLLCLNSSNMLQGWYRVAVGGMGSVGADIRVIATIAAKSAAFSIILAHNHPNGDLLPSKADIETTRAIKRGLQLIGAELKDHIIFTDTGYMSMQNNGYIR